MWRSGLVGLLYLTVVFAGFAAFAQDYERDVAAPTTITVEHPYGVPDDAILCPEQVGKTESCSRLHPALKGRHP
jgi:hypothetical protein